MRIVRVTDPHPFHIDEVWGPSFVTVSIDGISRPSVSRSAPLASRQGRWLPW